MGKASKRKKGRQQSGNPVRRRLEEIDPSLRGLKRDDEVPVLIVSGDNQPPEGAAGPMIGTLTKGSQLADGTLIPPGSRVYRSLRGLTSDEIRNDPGSTLMTISATDFAGYRESPVATPEYKGLPDPGAEGVLIPPGMPSLEQVREAEASVIANADTGDPSGLKAVAERMGQTHPGLMAKLAQGLSRDELQQMAPEIARAMHAAGAGSGTYTFTDQGEVAQVESTKARIITGGSRDDGEPGLPAGVQPGDIIADEQPLGYVEAGIDLPGGAEIAPGARVWRAADVAERPGFRGSEHGYQGGIIGGRPRKGPEIVITDNLDAMDTADVDLVIEDLDPDNPDDAGRLLVGRPEQVRRYHERARTLNERMMDRLGQRERRAVTTEAEADLIRLQTSWNADTVLGHHAWLTRHYRNPGAELADYLAFIMREPTNESFLSAGIFWPVDLSHGPADEPEGRQLAQILARGLGDAETFQVTRTMCEQMRQTWEQSGLNADPLPLSEGELPVPAGFCWLDRPWLIREDDGYWLPVRAVSWERTIVMTSSGGGPSRPADSVRMAAWLSVDDTVAFGQWEDPGRAARAANQLGQVVLHRVILLPFDFGDKVNPGHTALTGMLGLLHTLWLYLSAELPRSRPVAAQAPAVRRRVQKSLKHDGVHIITLRKYDYIGDQPGHFPKLVQWSCRWWVEQFYRHIDRYDDEDETGQRRRHKPIPALRTGTVYNDDHDICAVCLANGQTVRITLVRSFLKGPTDKPLRTPAKDRTLQRLSR